jgi:hypothetical protein
MASKAVSPTSSFAFGDDEESNLANQRYQDAYDKLTQAIEARSQKPWFDPTLLAAAQGFLTPTRTGSFFESLGNAAGTVGKAQELEGARDVETAKLRMELAGMGNERATQRGIMQNLARKAGMGSQPGAATQPGAAGQAGIPGAEEGLEAIGAFPRNPYLITSEQEFYKQAIQNGQRDPNAIAEKWVQYQKDFLSPKFEGGNVYDPIQGKIYGKNTGATATTTFMTGQGGSYSLPEAAVREHQRLIAVARKDPKNPEVWKNLEELENFWRTAHTGPVQTSQVNSSSELSLSPVPAPAAPPLVAPSAPPSVSPSVAPAPSVAPSVAPSSVPSFVPSSGSSTRVIPTGSVGQYVPLSRPPGRLSKEQEDAYEAGEKSRRETWAAAQKASNDARIAEEKAIADNIRAREAKEAEQREGARLAEEKAKADQKRAEDKAIADKRREKELAREKALIEAEEGAAAEGKKAEARKRAEDAVKKEAEIAQKADSAGRMFTAADTVIKSVTRSPSYFGVFDKPGALSSIGSTFSELLGGKIKLVDVEDKVVKLMPGTTPQNLLDRKNAAAALTEIELTFTQEFMNKEGQITEGERKIVRAIPGGLSDSAKFLELKSKLIRERAQFDMDVNLALEEYLKSKPNGNATDFVRSPLYKDIYNGFQRNLAEIGKTVPALPNKERQPNNASSYAEDLLRRRGQQ